VVEAKKEEEGIDEGEVDYVDEDRIKPKVLFSDHHNLSGRPDYILKINNRSIPVEIKTGRVPRGPLFSHIIQLACYMLIIENNFGTPPYGILRYGEREHMIEYTEELRKTLLEKIAEMRSIIETGEAHRNHKRAGKCRSCSRRSKCPERIKS
jgi:CRISPR-associated exonuclease Cas4